MPAQNLLTQNADSLFEEHTISEIEDTTKKLQSEIEKKKQELRTMVGERYRDLIEAADTISEMRATAEGVISHIDKMSYGCINLQQTHLLGFKFDPVQNKSERSSVNRSYHSIAIQIKILMMIPEKIWTALENHDFILGAQLFLLAQHINIGLEFEKGSSQNLYSAKVLQWFPVVTCQWSSISQFRATLLSGCELRLQLEELCIEEAVNCLCTLLLLENLGSLELLNKFLHLRTQALKNVLLTEKYSSVKNKICCSLKLLAETVRLLHDCFIDDSSENSKGNLISCKLKSIISRDAEPSVLLLNLDSSIGSKFIPPLVQEFRPSTSQKIDAVPCEDLKKCVTEWLSWVEAFINTEVGSQLELVSSIRGLHAVKKKASEQIEDKDWEGICKRLQISQGLNLWNDYIHPLIAKRASAIIENTWNSTVEHVKECLALTLMERNENQPEDNLNWFVWREWGTDVPQCTEEENRKQGLWMKAKGYSPCIEKLCNSFDTKLALLLQDTEPYLSDPTDMLQLQKHIQKSGFHCIENFVQYIDYEFLRIDNPDEACIVLLARFLQAICDLCPNLKKCLSLYQHKKLLVGDIGNIQDTNPWHEVCSMLHKKSIVAWQFWCRFVNQRLTSLVHSKLVTPLKSSSMLDSVPQWDIVEIDEQTDEGKIVKSNIKVPSQPSLPLQSLLHESCSQLNSIAPHTLPRKIHQDLIENFVSEIFTAYENFANVEEIHQSQALQFLLDIKYLTLLLVPRENKAQIGKSKSICDKLESKIDPFDMNVFSPYVQSNIKKSVQKTQSLLGILIAWPEKIITASAMRSGTSSILENPSVLPLSQSVPWFPLLPAVKPSLIQLQHKLQENMKTTVKPKNEPSRGDMMRSSAAALFNNWF